MNRALQEELKTASSIAAFESSSTDGIRQGLASVLIKVVSEECQLTGHNTSNCGITRYDLSQLSHCLSNSSSRVDWKSLCQDHDKRRERFYTTTNNGIATFSSPLQEVVNQLLDPRVIPHALASSILFVLVKAFSRHSSSPLPHPTKKARWNPSQKLLLQAIRRVMASRQYREDLGSIILAVYTSLKTGSTNGTSPNAPHRIVSDPTFRMQRSIYSLIKYFLEEPPSEKTLQSSAISEYCPILAFFPSLLVYLQYILSEGATILPPSSNDQGSTRNSSYCRSCGINMELRRMAARRRKRVACADLAMLHGEVGDDNDDDNNDSDHQAKINSSPGPRTMYHSSSSKPITLKSVIQAKDTAELPRISTTPCPNCQHVATPQHDRTDVPDESTITAWCQLRDKCIHTMISSFQSAKFLPRRRPYRLLQYVISVACHSPCLRLCTLQLAHILGDRGYEYLISSLWERATENVSYFTWYAEVIAISTFCNKREHCWEAMQPLIKQVRALCQEDGKSNNNNNCDTQNGIAPRVVEPPFTPYLGYILSRRWRLLQTVGDDEISRDFSSLVTELSWTFGDANDWIAPLNGIDSDSEHQLTASLHSLGILSAFSEVQHDIDGDAKDGSGNSDITAQQVLFVPDLKGLYRVYKQMLISPGEAVGFNAHTSSGSMLYELNQSLLSDLNHDKKQVLPLTAKITDDDVMERGEVTPMLHMLDNDVLRNVFSFLGYKKLAKIRRVCSTWKELSDEDRSWLPIYRRRFGLLGFDEAESKPVEATIGEATPSLWKSRFVGKWLAERPVRFKVNKKKNFKYQICQYVDCQHVIISPEHIKKHHAFHRKQKALQEKRKTKIESKKDSKAVKGATTSSKKRKSSHPTSAPKKIPRALNPCTSFPLKHAKPVAANAMASL